MTGNGINYILGITFGTYWVVPTLQEAEMGQGRKSRALWEEIGSQDGIVNATLLEHGDDVHVGRISTTPGRPAVSKAQSAVTPPEQPRGDKSRLKA